MNRDQLSLVGRAVWRCPGGFPYSGLDNATTYTSSVFPVKVRVGAAIRTARSECSRLQHYKRETSVSEPPAAEEDGVILANLRDA